MSAEPTMDPAAYAVNAPGHAPVLSLSKHRARASRGALYAVQGRRAMTNPPAPDTPTPASATEEARRLADAIETSMLEIGRSLAEPDTAAVYLRTLEWCKRFLEGSHAGGVIDAEQLAILADDLKAFQQAPHHI